MSRNVRAAERGEEVLDSGANRIVLVRVKPETGRPFSFLARPGTDGVFAGGKVRIFVEVDGEGAREGRTQVVEAVLVTAEIPVGISKVYGDLVRLPEKVKTNRIGRRAALALAESEGFKKGDRVVRVIDVGTRSKFGEMEGTVVRTRDLTQVRRTGGVRARVRVLWDGGFEGLLDDRQIATVAEAQVSKEGTSL